MIATLQEALTGKSMASVFRQDVGSNYLSALARHGGLTALVYTTNIYTLTDDVVQPESLPYPTSVPAGDRAVNVLVQDICPLRVEGHFAVVIDVITEFFVLQAFSSKHGMVDPGAVNTKHRALLCANALPQFTGVDSVLAFSTAVLTSAISTGVTGTPGSYVSAEPALMSYAR